MIDTRYLTDVFDSLMPYIRENYDTVNQEEPYYMYGTIKNITKQLKEKDKGEFKYKKYPLILLIQPFSEDHGTNSSISYTASPRVSILTPSEYNYNSPERYTNTYKTILYPIYKLLLKSIERSNYIYTIGGVNKIDHEKIDQLNYGDDQRISNIFNSFLDGLDFQFNNLNVLPNLYACQ